MADIIYFPGCEPPDHPSDDTPAPVSSAPPAADVVLSDQSHVAPLPESPEGMTPALRKAIGIIESGMPFVIVGMSPTTSGCDFHSSVVGDPAVIGPAAQHIATMANKALSRAGFTV